MLCLSLHQRDLNEEIISALPYTGKPFTIGRAGEVRTKLMGTFISRVHAKVTPHDDFWLVEDLGSRNGIYDDNRRRVESVALTKSGDSCWIAAPRNDLGAIWITVIESDVCQRDRETVRIDLHAWRKKALAAIDDLADLVLTNADSGGDK